MTSKPTSYIYILFSESAQKFYVGHSADPYQRAIVHNTTDRSTFTSKHRPWKLIAVFEVKSGHSAKKLESFIKRQKSQEFIRRLVDSDTVLTGVLAQLVRVPNVRD